MIDLNNCIICSSKDNLNTEITINMDGNKTSVKICDEHCDDITPRAAKEAYLERKKQIDAIIEQAKALGLDISQPSSSGIVTANQIASPPPIPAKTNQIAQPEQIAADFSVELNGDEEQGILSTSRADEIGSRVKGVGGVAIGGNLSANLSSNAPVSMSDLESKLPENARVGKVKMGLVEGRQGQPVAIQEIRQDGLGTTRISVAQGVNDSDLQRRFKVLASNLEEGAHGFAKDGYDVHDCTFCNGTGSIRVSKSKMDLCPKCKGTGLI